jgi:hypothetical protein
MIITDEVGSELFSRPFQQIPRSTNEINRNGPEYLFLISLKAGVPSQNLQNRGDAQNQIPEHHVNIPNACALCKAYGCSFVYTTKVNGVVRSHIDP